ncbi:hypothetical protein BJF83_05665 [Nocardiopsis sp. CNR-923]|uniref:hypothetical protein n=1 Tax=Nocardiopsis sp. CNR-923 TaxID=1904965 RepID=UPI00095C3EED|nr:hypothetical protein [Nocardiopsis sp. CNR-923]OLT24974.1 hypothetical protein BJF83_05665 [Nocardiopsis sp. CNR-923]
MTDPKKAALGLPLPVLVLLALLAVPRVVLHDLSVIAPATFVNWLLVVVPPLVWIAVVLIWKVPNPFVTLLVVGIIYGVLLALGHQLLWGQAFGDDPPTLGGNLSDLAPGAQALIIRGFSVLSSLVTGTIVGALAGLAALGAQRLLRVRT